MIRGSPKETSNNCEWIETIRRHLSRLQSMVVVVFRDRYSLSLALKVKAVTETRRRLLLLLLKFTM